MGGGGGGGVACAVFGLLRILFGEWRQAFGLFLSAETPGLSPLPINTFDFIGETFEGISPDFLPPTVHVN